MHFSLPPKVSINSRETHSIYFQPDFGNREFHQIVLKFDPQILYTAGNNAIEYRYVYPFLLSAHDCQRIFSYEENCSSEIPNIMENILSDYTNKTYAYEMRMHMNILRVFIWLLDKWKEANTFLIDNDKFDSAKRFDSLFHHISKNYDTGIGTAQAAKMCYMSYGYFCRLFRNLTGKTFNEYLNSVRLLKAQQLLVSTNSSITDIAYSVGFKDTSYFIRKFKSQTGNTPEKFRQSFKLK